MLGEPFDPRPVEQVGRVFQVKDDVHGGVDKLEGQWELRYFRIWPEPFDGDAVQGEAALAGILQDHPSHRTAAAGCRSAAGRARPLAG